MELFIARNKDGGLHLFRNKPTRFEWNGVGVYVDADNPNPYSYPMDLNSFPELTWENSPKKVELKIIE